MWRIALTCHAPLTMFYNAVVKLYIYIYKADVDRVTKSILTSINFGIELSND